MSKIRVLHIIPSLEKAGAERMAVEICLELSKRENFEVLLVSLSPVNCYKNYTDKFPFRVCSSYVKLSISGKTQKDLSDFASIVNDFKPHIIHSHLFVADMLSKEMLFPGVSYFTHQHGPSKVYLKPTFKSYFSKEKLARIYERNRIFNRYRECNNTFIAISSYIESFIKTNFPEDIHNIVLIPNGINIEAFRKSALHNWKYSNGGSETLKLVSVGTLIPRKNQKLQIDILGELLKAGINASLTIIGDGIGKEKLAGYVEASGLSGKVIFKGNVDNVAEYFADADIMLHTAINEPFGLVIAEALAAGLPCVTLDGMGNREIIKDGENGYIIPSQDVKQFVEKIIYINSSYDIWRNFSQKAIESSKLFDIKNYVDKLEKIYIDSVKSDC